MNPKDVEYDLTIDDIIAYYVYALPRIPTSKASLLYRVLLYSMIAFNLFAIGVFVWLDGFPPPLLFVSAGAIVVMLVIQAPAVVRRKKLKGIRRLFDQEEPRKLLGIRRVTVGPDVITFANQFGSSFKSWNAIVEITTTPGYAFLQESDLDAVIVPRRAFADDVAYQDFIQAAQYFKAKASERTAKGL